jgi:hypothetical protein
VKALLVVHVVLAIFLIGPLVAAVNQVPRVLRGGEASAGALPVLTRMVTVYGWASLLVGLLGFGLVHDYASFSDGWLIVSIVLWVVASGLILSLVVPLLNTAAKRDTAALAPRLAAAGGVASLCYVVIAILMVWRP